MGWRIFKERTVKSKLGFLKKIERSSEERWTKRILQRNRTKSYWRKDLERWKWKENLTDEWIETDIKGTE